MKCLNISKRNISSCIPTHSQRWQQRCVDDGIYTHVGCVHPLSASADETSCQVLSQSHDAVNCRHSVSAETGTPRHRCLHRSEPLTSAAMQKTQPVITSHKKTTCICHFSRVRKTQVFSKKPNPVGLVSLVLLGFGFYWFFGFFLFERAVGKLVC